MVKVSNFLQGAGGDWSNLDNNNNYVDSCLVTGSNHGTSRPGRQCHQASLIGSVSPSLQSSVLLLIVYGFHFCSVLGCFKMQLTAVMMWKRGGKSIIYKVPQLHKCCGGSRHCNAQTLMKPCADLEIMKVAMTDLVEIIKIILFINWTWTVTAKLHQTATKILFGFY